MNLDTIIKSAKLGRERNNAQVDTCHIFAIALHDVLKSMNIACSIYVVNPVGLGNTFLWYHSIVRVNNKDYDSMGEFSEDIYRNRAKIHPKVHFTLNYEIDSYFDVDNDYKNLRFSCKTPNRGYAAMTNKQLYISS